MGVRLHRRFTFWKGGIEEKVENCRFNLAEKKGERDWQVGDKRGEERTRSLNVGLIDLEVGVDFV